MTKAEIPAMRMKGTLPVLTLAAAGFLFASIPLRADPPPAGELDTKKIVWSAPTGYSKLEGGKLTVNVPPGVKSTAIFGITGTIPACMIESAMALKATVRARGKDIRKPEISYLGVKFQFRLYDAMTGMSRYPNTPTVKCGSFDWRELEVFAVLGGLQTGQDATLSLGLQGTSGEIEFDMSSLSIKPVTDIFPRENADHVACYSPDVRNMGQMRGVMLTGGRDLTEDDFREMSSWGVKLGRYQIIRGWNAWTKGPTDTDLAEYDAWIGTRLYHLEKTVLPMARKYGMKIVVDVHSPPGGRNQAGEMMMFYDTRFRDHFIALWKRIATRFKGNTDAIYGYDLVNEPQQLRPAKHDYWSVQRDAADAVRRIDPHTPVIIESNNMDTPATFAYLNPLTLTNVIYSVHMYIPSDYTHQGVLGGGPMPYPDPKRGRNRDWLRKTLGNVREFQNRHGARIYVGEFSAAAWAEGADRYIEDCISIFKEYGWDWTYHSFRGWNGWSVEHEGDSIKTMRPSVDNPRKRALLKGLKNEN